MKVLSVECNTKTVDELERQLTDIGCRIIKRVSMMEIDIYGLYHNVGELVLIFAVLDEEALTLLALRWPPGTFTERMA